jgi:hypothetical protein
MTIKVTEKEIFNGILSKGKNLPSSVLYFEREIDGIEEQVGKSNHKLISKFIDLDNRRRVDRASMDLLDKLKEKSAAKLPDTNKFKFNVHWDPEVGISRETHGDYIKKFGETFYERVKELIDTNQKQETVFERLKQNDANLLQEVLHHAYFCNDTVSHFHGREDILLKVMKNSY